MNFFSAFDDECPDPYRARREGEEAGHRGWGLSNPYTERARENRDQTYCEEAEQAWRFGRYAGEDRRREEEDREAQHQAYLAREREIELETEYEEAFAQEVQSADEFAEMHREFEEQVYGTEEEE